MGVFSGVKNRGIVRASGGAMAVRKVLQLGDPGLREICKEVGDTDAPEIRGLVEDL